MTPQLIEAGELMARRNGSVDPVKFPDEEFELHSIPAFDTGRPEVLRGREIGSTKQIVQPNDVMISKIVPHIRRSSVVGPMSSRRQIASGEWIVFRSDLVFPHYLRHLLVSDQFNAKFMSTVSGVGGSLLRARPAEVAKIKIPLPSIPEQRRIAAILDKADALRAKRREAIAKLDQLLQSVFLDMFGDPVTNPKGWPKAALASLTSKMGSGATPKGGDSSYHEEGISFIRSLNVHDGEFRYKNLAFIDDGQAQRLSGVAVKSGDVLLNITGASVARVCRVPDDVLPARVNQHVAIIRCSAGLSSAFLEHVLMSTSMKNALLRTAGAGATREAITKKQIEELQVPVPPIADQERFAALVQRIIEQGRLAERHLKRQENLFVSLQTQAFSGGM